MYDVQKKYNYINHSPYFSFSSGMVTDLKPDNFLLKDPEYKVVKLGGTPFQYVFIFLFSKM